MHVGAGELGTLQKSSKLEPLIGNSSRNFGNNRHSSQLVMPKVRSTTSRVPALMQSVQMKKAHDQNFMDRSGSKTK